MARSAPAGERTARPMRADARRNRELLLAAALTVFAEKGADAALEDVARSAGVGVGTLYRHFPNRQALLEAVYVDEVEALCASADDFAGLPAWDALVAWLYRFVDYVHTKKALADELLATLGMDAPVFQACHDAIFATGRPMLERARDEGAVRAEVDFPDLISLVSGIAMIKWRTPDEVKRLLAVALDGLRFRRD